jgi:hypothetical protein
MSGVPPIDNVMDLVEQAYKTHHYAQISLKVASGKVNVRSSNYQEEEHV